VFFFKAKHVTYVAQIRFYIEMDTTVNTWQILKDTHNTCDWHACRTWHGSI